jgi:thiamine-monophosphate kinase
VNEFALIKRYFKQHGSITSDDSAQNVVIGIGDDCAVLVPDPGSEIVVTTDTLVAGVHFPEHANPALIAQRALRVNLSDIAAMGATPCWFLLALTLPELDEVWLERFSGGLREVSDTYDCSLVGGDTTRGPLTVTVSVLGRVPAGAALVRSGACVGDKVYVTGSLGDAGAGLGLLKGTNSDSGSFGSDSFDRDGFDGNSSKNNRPESRVSTGVSDYLLERFWQPTPRLVEGQILRDYASAAIDISDGLLADLGHICEVSNVGAELIMDSIPLSTSLTEVATKKEALALALTAGDDYELCFTVPQEKVAELESKIDAGLLSAQRVGGIVRGEGVICLDEDGLIVNFPIMGYQHF